MDSEKTKRKPRGLRKDGRILVTLTQKVDGISKRVYFYGSTRKEAEAKRDAYIRQRESGIDPFRNLTVNEWIEEWKTAYSVDTNYYQSYIDVIQDCIGKKDIRAIREADLNRVMKEASGKSRSYATKLSMLIKQIMHTAKRNHLIADDPSEDISIPEDTTSGSHRALEPWEISIIINHWDAHRAGLWALIMLLCGLRRGELIALDWNRVDLENASITIDQAASFKTENNTPTIKPQTKTRAGMRTVPICDFLLSALKTIPAENREGPVCISASGSSLTLTAFRANWHTWCDVMERIINHEPISQHGKRNDRIAPEDRPPRIAFRVRPHDLRHTYATVLYEAGIDPKAAQHYLGHADMRMTQELYTHLSESRIGSTGAAISTGLNDWIKKLQKTS